jgi:hypothetical protein
MLFLSNLLLLMLVAAQFNAPTRLYPSYTDIVRSNLTQGINTLCV